MKELERVKMLEFLVKREDISPADIKEVAKILNFPETDVLIAYSAKRNLERAIELAILLTPKKEISYFLARTAVSEGLLWELEKLIETRLLTVKDIEKEIQSEEFINAVQDGKIKVWEVLNFIEKYKIYTDSVCEICCEITQLCLKKDLIEDAFRAAKIAAKIGTPKGMGSVNVLVKTVVENGWVSEIKEIEKIEKILGKDFTTEIEAVVKNAIRKVITATGIRSWRDIKYGMSLLSTRGKKFFLTSEEIDQMVMSYSKTGFCFSDAISVVQDLGASRKAIDFLIKKSIEFENLKMAVKAGKKFGISKQLSFELVKLIISKPHYLHWISHAVELRRKTLTCEEVDQLVRKILNRCYPSTIGAIESSINVIKKFGASQSTVNFLVNFCLKNDLVWYAGEVVTQFESGEEVRKVVIEKCLKQRGIKQALKIVQRENRKFSSRETEILLKSFI